MMLIVVVENVILLETHHISNITTIVFPLWSKVPCVYVYFMSFEHSELDGK